MQPTSSRLVIVLGTFVAAALASSAMAQEQVTQTTAAPVETVNANTAPAHPARGTTMESVKAKFGAPTQEIPPVGRPAISRWEYPGYVVFFENDKVLHTVIAK